MSVRLSLNYPIFIDRINHDNVILIAIYSLTTLHTSTVGGTQKSLPHIINLYNQYNDIVGLMMDVSRLICCFYILKVTYFYNIISILTYWFILIRFTWRRKNNHKNLIVGIICKFLEVFVRITDVVVWELIKILFMLLLDDDTNTSNCSIFIFR
jgi:hypothetical protein